MHAGLGVDDDQLTAGLDEPGDQVIGILDHQVGLERHRNRRADRGDDIGTEGQVRDETAVHHIELDPIHPGLLQGLALLAQPGEIGREHRGGDQDGRHPRRSRGRVR